MVAGRISIANSAWVRSIALGLILAIALALPASGRAATPADEECLTCHSEATLPRSPGRPTATAYVNAAVLKASVHASIRCAQCHAGVSGFPHAERLPAVRCETCHAAIAKTVSASVHRASADAPGCAGCHGSHDVQPAKRLGMSPCAACHADVSRDYASSVHGMARTHGDGEASTCRDCHGSIHAIRSNRDSTSSTARANLAATCARCHADRELMTRRKITIPEAVQLYRASVHGRSKNPKAATCNDCHESHRLRRANDPASSINRTHIAATCGRCHAREAHDYQISVHGTAVARGVTASPVCIGCHGEHRVRGPADPSSPVAAAGVGRTCSHCHEAEGIRETYGLPAGRLATWQDSFHGLAARGGSPAVANCASCHGYHAILPSSDPRSDVSPKNLARTCGKCHPGAGEKFAAGAVHVATARPEHPLTMWVRRLYLWLIGLTIGGMLVHNLLDFSKKMSVRFRQHIGAAVVASSHAAQEAGRFYIRMTPGERVQHALLLGSFFTLVYTGFALKFPEAFPFSWMARLDHGYALRSLIHRAAAGVMVGVALAHVVYLFNARGRGLFRDMIPTLKDGRDAVENLLYLSGLRRTPPAFARFGYIEKAEYWALIWGTGVMTLTGLMLWFENLSLRFVDKWVLDLATLIHYYEAWLAFLAILVWHLYYVMLNPDVYPMNFTWLTGRIPEEQMRHEHAAEWERLVREEAAAEEAGSDSPGEG